MTDLIILGNGMAGMTAALYAARANLDFKIVGREEYDFGQITNAISVENYPCVAGLSGFDLAYSLYNQLNEIGVNIEEHEVINIFKDKGNNCFVIEYNDGTIANAKTIIYALGASHRKLNCRIEGEVPIHYCALCDGSLYKDKDVAVIGGGDSAFTQAEYLSKICKTVGIVMCDKNITAASTTFNRVSEIKNIKIAYDFPITAIGRNSDGTFLLYSESAKGYKIIDGIFVAIGMIPNTQSIISPSFPIITDTFGYIMSLDDGTTTIPGFFAAGDVRAKQLRQAITAAADGANAVQSAINYLKQN